MLKLTKVERDFLKEHGILESELFDARDMGGPEFNPIMKELGIEFAVGRSCKNAGHRLRTRSNHCVQCDTARISFQRRWNSDGDVYVAHSPSRKLIKVGTADCPYSRTDSLNSYKYGGASDWSIAYAVHTENAGRIEHTAQTALQRHRTDATYHKDGVVHDCKELFKSSKAAAIGAVEAAIAENNAVD